MARKERTDLIVLGPHTGLANELGGVHVSGMIGSTVQGLIMHERCADFNVWGGALLHLEILKCAGKKDADFIVMKSHTKEKGGKWYVGNAVERVSYRSICPVVVVPDPKVLLTMD